MTILHIVAVKDLAVETFARPFVVAHPRQAVRSFSDETNNPESEIHKHAEDYELWLIGSFDDVSGVVKSTTERLARAMDLKKA